MTGDGLGLVIGDTSRPPGEGVATITAVLIAIASLDQEAVKGKGSPVEWYLVHLAIIVDLRV